MGGVIHRPLVTPAQLDGCSLVERMEGDATPEPSAWQSGVSGGTRPT
jgi:hypothetical protein